MCCVLCCTMVLSRLSRLGLSWLGFSWAVRTRDKSAAPWKSFSVAPAEAPAKRPAVDAQLLEFKQNVRRCVSAFAVLLLLAAVETACLVLCRPAHAEPSPHRQPPPCAPHHHHQLTSPRRTPPSSPGPSSVLLTCPPRRPPSSCVSSSRPRPPFPILPSLPLPDRSTRCGAPSGCPWT